MRILFLAQGDAETWDSWSGSAKSVVDHLRAHGHQVICGNCELERTARWTTLLRTFAPTRRRWWVRYHLGPEGFRARSLNAQRLVDTNAGGIDGVLQVGATFQVTPPEGVPIAIYCDANIALAIQGIPSGFSEAASLTASELEGIRDREAQVYRGVDHVFTMSDRLRQTFVEDFGLPPSKVETVRAGPNFERGKHPEVPTRSEEPSATVLFIGRAFERKGGPLLLEAFPAVREVVSNARLLIVGPDQLPEPWRSRGLPQGVEFWGFLNKADEAGRNRLMQAYRESQIFCLPTRFEPFGVVFLEAMHFELACVGPDQWAVPEIIDDGATGRLFAAGDARSLATVLSEQLSDLDKSVRMGRAGKQRLKDRFTWEQTTDRIAEFFREHR